MRGREECNGGFNRKGDRVSRVAGAGIGLTFLEMSAMRRVSGATHVAVPVPAVACSDFKQAQPV